MAHESSRCVYMHPPKRFFNVPRLIDRYIAGLIYTTWEQVGDQGCYLPLLPADGSAPAPIQGNCTLGGMSSYVVNATNADDIAKTVKFTAEKKLRLRVKNVSVSCTWCNAMLLLILNTDWTRIPRTISGRWFLRYLDALHERFACCRRLRYGMRQ